MSLVPVLSCPTVPLSNGLQIPILGLGTSHFGGFSHEAVVYALAECGVRHIDTAKRYNCEERLGKAIKDSGVPRRDLWLTNKLWPGDYGYKDAKRACLESCSAMGVDYFDLYLMHWPEAESLTSGCSNREMRAETWRALEELYEEGICRAIGVSNFLVSHLEQLKEDCSVVPHVNQVEYHPFQQPKPLIDYCRKEGIVFEGYSPLAKGQVFSDATVQQIAEKHKRTAAQICIRWSIQVFSFQLDEADMATLGGLHDGRHVTWDPTNVK
ncbi:uncharacterized oxidoreductase ZK1290.5 isoform X2 [Austrofundulus limnaeus]|uniref:Uncharacterized oxidoreductase ZK1290.5 isoform X2 n=1 Tax=Austrofundulus limnaeus TaxID=52670 RepID=A0A2I4D523_AUSLI|nr:PREDICTED: uncharacterized oxidoreductase ZK1290.5-like isoform X2 [Austrofundulus limnaeus]